MIEKLVGKISEMFVSPVHADALGDRISSRITELTQAPNLQGFVNALVNLAIPLGVLAAVGWMIYAGYAMITSEGNPDKINEARDVVTNAIIGFALIALSVAVLLLIRNTLNLSTSPTP
jgi:hypothetical protein